MECNGKYLDTDLAIYLGTETIQKIRTEASQAQDSLDYLDYLGFLDYLDYWDYWGGDWRRDFCTFLLH